MLQGTELELKTRAPPFFRVPSKKANQSVKKPTGWSKSRPVDEKDDRSAFVKKIRRNQ
jgi:hypothetical protein